ncbi:MAG: DinB family protein [Myxococcaceae bacterium]|nr:DinB family protein [Myxococcaceae bacterium]
MAAYNRAMNQRLYEASAQLTDEQRRAERGAFFGSIHRTLNHILWSDARAVAPILGTPVPPEDTKHEMHAEFDALRRHRVEIDGALIMIAGQVTQASLDAPTTVSSVATGRTRTWPTSAFIVHLFNHQTHHRGQVTTLLMQLGQDVGVTDIPWLELDYGF